MYLINMGYGLNSTGPGQDRMAGFCDTIKTFGSERNRVAGFH